MANVFSYNEFVEEARGNMNGLRESTWKKMEYNIVYGPMSPYIFLLLYEKYFKCMGTSISQVEILS